MGGIASSAHSNSELVDNLVIAKYITSKNIELVFRAVDRGNYVPVAHKRNAYKDLACKEGNIHLSAPCVYSKVMEGLSLDPGMSFLNLGSGTGYLSTIAGLILTHCGTNHGVELYEDCVKYAYERLEEFKQSSLALDSFDFCEPVFVQGNCLSISPIRRYDRVYCGAGCPRSHESVVKQFVRVGGILVMPLQDSLLRIQRLDETTWAQTKMIPISFATMVVPAKEEQTLFRLPDCNPLSLRALCRGKIRHCLRQNVWQEHYKIEIRPLMHRRGRKSFEDYDAAQFIMSLPTWQGPETISTMRSILEFNTISETESESGESVQEEMEECSEMTEDANSNSQIDSIDSNANDSESLEAIDKERYVHFINSSLFHKYMKQNIHQLPLPLSLKLYINYNRPL